MWIQLLNPEMYKAFYKSNFKQILLYVYFSSSEEDEDDMLTGLISPPMLHEEETVESTWAPPV